MPLTERDIRRIEKLGYRRNEFVRYVNGVPTLRTKEDGSCVFLENGRCKIYPYRPEGCRLYPLVWVKNAGRATLDTYCPYRYEFKFTKEDVKRLMKLVREIYGSSVVKKEKR